MRNMENHVFTLESFMDKGPCHIDTPFDKEQDIAVTTPDFHRYKCGCNAFCALTL